MSFQKTIDQNFPGSLPLEDYMQKTFEVLLDYGFNADNTFACVSACRDEIAMPLFDQTDKVWGEVFNFSSLAGSLTLGKTGFAAATSHAPVIEGLERYVFIAMPHIAIGKNGEIGIVYREGRDKPSHACGALDAIVSEINSGNLDLKLDFDDIEQSILKGKIFDKMEYGKKPNLVEITKITHEIILEDLERLISVVHKNKKNVDYAVLTGIMIHGPNETNFVFPQNFYSVQSEHHEKTFLTLS